MQKKADVGTILRCLPTSAYSVTNLPTEPGCSSPRHPTTSSLIVCVRGKECNELVKGLLKQSPSELDLRNLEVVQAAILFQLD